MPTLYPVIMSGGSGSRLWPLSRKATPKQYLPLISETSLLQETVERVASDHGAGIQIAAPIIICAAGHEDEILGQCARAGVTPLRMILEPMGRNTAAVAAIAAAEVQAHDPDGLVLLLPADHHVTDPAGFWQAIKAGYAPAADGHLITLGIQPRHAETAYGYIRTGSALTDTVFKVDRFEEKPDKATAEAYVKSGEYYWNAGIFLFRADTILSECTASAPDIAKIAVDAWEKGARAGIITLLDAATFATCPSDSIDYAIMEKTDRAAIVAPVNVGWNDIGSWDALSALVRGAPENNHAGDDAILIDCKSTYARSTGPQVAVIGLDNLIVIATDDAVLVMDDKRSQDVKKVVEQLKADKRNDLL